MRTAFLTVFVTFAAHAQNAPCDLTGLWIGETKMDRSKVAPTPSRIDLKSADGRMQVDGSARLVVSAAKPGGSPNTFILQPDATCSHLEGKWATEIDGKRYGGTAVYARQAPAKP